MMNGSAVLEGYVPEADATIVNRILDAGGEISGKAVCESFCVAKILRAARVFEASGSYNPARLEGIDSAH